MVEKMSRRSSLSEDFMILHLTLLSPNVLCTVSRLAFIICSDSALKDIEYFANVYTLVPYIKFIFYYKKTHNQQRN